MAKSGAGIMVVAGSISALSKAKVQDDELTMTQKFFNPEAARALCWPRADRLERIAFFHGQAGVLLVASAT